VRTLEYPYKEKTIHFKLPHSQIHLQIYDRIKTRFDEVCSRRDLALGISTKPNESN